jgi:hypothetical protein
MIGVLGAYGSVGVSVARSLAAAGLRLRVGGRDPARTAAVSGLLGTPAPMMVVDATDLGQLARFCAGCEVVVNCAGPSSRIGDAVARAASAAGAGYVDVGGDLTMAADLAGCPGPAVVGAGISPGLTGLLPRWLATRLPEPPVTLRAWCGGLQEFTPAAAVDMLASLHDGYGVALASWRDGGLVRHACPARTDTTLPPFPGRVSVLPYLSAETQLVAGRLGLREVEWFNVFAGRRTLAVLNQVPPAPDEADLAAARTRLIDAATADAAGLRPYQLLMFELAGRTQVRSLVVRGEDGYRLTAATAVAAVHAVLAGRVPAGAHLAADVLDPEPVVEELRRDGSAGVVLSDARADDVEEGGI